MPLLNTAPAACGSCMLGNKYRVSFYRCLLTIIFRGLGSYSCGYEIESVLPDGVDTLILNIGEVFIVERKLGSKGGSFKRLQSVVYLGLHPEI